MKMPSKKMFLDAYREELLKRSEWASNPRRLDDFMAEVQASIDPDVNNVTVSLSGAAFDAACLKVGLQAKTPRKVLRTLPNNRVF